MDLLRPISRYLMVPLFAYRNRQADFKYVRETEEAQYRSPAELAGQQFEDLQRVLLHAREQCPFYATRFAEAGFDPARMTSVAELQKLPLLSKADIQQHRDDMIARNFPKESLVKNQTGGSTGSPLRFFHDRECIYRRQASTIRHDRWAGMELWDKSASLWGHRADFLPPSSFLSKVREATVSRRVMLDTSHITAQKLAQFVETLRQEKPTTYIAYANSLYLLARYIRERGLTDYHRPKSVITSAELLADDQRTLIESVFDCRVFNRYGCRETSVIASECEEHRGMHLCSDRLYVEFVNAGGVCGPDQLGEIVITDLRNYGMPFIRYRIRDMGSASADTCTCGRNLPLMNMVGGRVTDFLVTPAGDVVSGAAMTIYFVAHVPGVAQAQLVQKERDRLLVRLVKDASFGDESHAKIREAVKKFFGPRMTYEVELVPEIPSEASGKYRFSISEIDPLEYLL